jgi:prepilin-type N-terminal cleavage/methylation domain-containing protein
LEFRCKQSRANGFTLIEIMIVIALIGIIAAIAIPHYMAHRNKALCAEVEDDARNTLAAINEYFSEPEHTMIPGWADIRGFNPGNGIANVTIQATDPNSLIQVTVNDGSGRCPRQTQYQASMPEQVTDGWQ